MVVFNFLRSFHTIFHSVCTNLHSHQQCTKGSLLSASSPTLVIYRLLITAILTGVRCHLIVVLICISLVVSFVEHLFLCLLAICMSLLEKRLCRYSAHFFNQIVSLIELSCSCILDAVDSQFLGRNVALDCSSCLTFELLY